MIEITVAVSAAQRLLLAIFLVQLNPSGYCTWPLLSILLNRASYFRQFCQVFAHHFNIVGTLRSSPAQKEEHETKSELLLNHRNQLFDL